MALIALGVTGGIGAYKAVEVRRGLQKRGHDVVAVMTRSATRFVGPVTFEAITRRPVITDPVRSRARTPTSSTSRSPIEHRAAARRAGDGQRHRQVRQRHRRRLPDLALSRDAGAGADRAGDEHQHAGARGRAAESADAGRARRALRRARARAIWRAAGSARGGSPSPTTIVDGRGCASLAPRDASLRGRRVLVTAGPDLRRHRSRALHRQSIERPDGLRDRRRGRARAARDVTLVAGPTRVEPPRGRRSRSRAQRRRDARGRDARAPSMPTSSIMAAAVADYTPADARPAEDREGRRTADARRSSGRRTSSRSSAQRRRGARRRPCWSALPPRPATCRERRATKRVAQGRRSHRRQRRHRADAGFDVDTNAVTIVGARRRARRCRCRRKTGVAARDPRSRRAAAAPHVPPTRARRA